MTDIPDATRLHALTLACAAYGGLGHAAVTEAAEVFERYLRLDRPQPSAVAAGSTRAFMPPAVPVDQSVRPGAVVCLECGLALQMLKRHLRTAHALDVAAYRARWGLAKHHPLTAPAYSHARSLLAVASGLGSKREVVS